MSVIIKIQKSLREIKKEWLAHQINRDPNFLSRREFLGQSAAGITALTFMPSIFSLMTQSQAARGDVSFSAAAVVLSLPGGFSASAECVPLNRDGEFLTTGSYAPLGVPGKNPSTAGVVNTDFGYPLWSDGRLNRVLTEINQTIKDLGGKVYVTAGFNSNSQDDSKENPTLAGPEILAAIKKIGVKFRVNGTQVNSNNAGGGQGLPTADFPGMKPAVASTLDQAQDLLTGKNGVLKDVSPNMLVAAAAMAKKLTEGASARFAAMNSGRQLSELVKTANQDLIQSVGNPISIDPRLDSNIATAFGIQRSTDAKDPRVPIAASIKMVADGYSPLTTIQLPPVFDYHDGTTNWNADGGPHDQVMSTLKSILLALAGAKRSAAIMLQTDGATGFRSDTQIAQSDASPIHGSIWIFLCMKGEPGPKRILLGGMRSSDRDGGSANPDPSVNILMRGKSYEGHVLTASLLGMQGLKPEDFGAPSIPMTDYIDLNLFKS